jgi:LDH2 family malate/lactate/ureidoglycolate dehydrogenase
MADAGCVGILTTNGSPTMAPEEIFCPGEIGARAESAGRASGHAPDQTVVDVRELRESCGLSFDRTVLEDFA